MDQQPIRLPADVIPALNLTLSKVLPHIPDSFPGVYSFSFCHFLILDIPSLVSYYFVLILLLLHEMAVQFHSFPVSLFYGVLVCIGGLSKF
jgi:hypothetical protein